MTDGPSAGGKSGDDRAERLAAALRENLKKRKARARAAGEAAGQGDGDADESPARDG